MNAILGKIDDALTGFAHKKWRYWVIFPGLLLLLYLVYFIFCFVPYSYSDIYASGSTIDSLLGVRSYVSAIVFISLSLLLIIALILSLIFLKKQGRLTSGKITVFFIIQYGILITLFTFLVKANTSLGHSDWCVFDYYTANDSAYRPGHWKVILDIFRSGLLPDPPVVNGSYWFENQYYQNKFFHLAMGYFMRWNGLFVNVGSAITPDAAANAYSFTETEYVLMEMNRILQVYFGLLMPIFFAKLIKTLGFEGKRVSLTMGLFLAIPMILLLPLFLNNDLLAFDFTLLALIYALKWHQNPTYRNIVFSGLAMGLGMATKFSVGMMAFVIGPLFLYDLGRIYQKKDQAFLSRYAKHPYWNLYGQFACFAAIVFPLGLFFTIFNNLQYGIPLGYVWDNGHNARIFVNEEYYNAFLRYVLFPAPDMFFSIAPLLYRQGSAGAYFDVWGTQDFNIWTGFFKSALFNGANFFDYEMFHAWYYQVIFYTISVVYFLLAIYIVFSAYFYLGKIIKAKGKGYASERTLFLALLSLVEILSYLYFNFRYPYTCTMHARYILPFFVPLCLFSAKILEEGANRIKALRPNKE